MCRDVPYYATAERRHAVSQRIQIERHFLQVTSSNYPAVLPLAPQTGLPSHISPACTTLLLVVFLPEDDEALLLDSDEPGASVNFLWGIALLGRTWVCGTPALLYFRRNSLSVKAPLRVLHVRQSNWKLLFRFVPPRETGFLWSKSNRSLRTLLPQYIHRPFCFFISSSVRAFLYSGSSDTLLFLGFSSSKKSKKHMIAVLSINSHAEPDSATGCEAPIRELGPI